MQKFSRLLAKKAQDFWLKELYPIFQSLHNSTGAGDGTWDARIQLTGDSSRVDNMIVARVGWAHMWIGTVMRRKHMVEDGKKAMKWLVEHQETDGRWERRGEGPTLDETFDTSDAIEALMNLVELNRTSWTGSLIGLKDDDFAKQCWNSARQGVEWLINGKIRGIYSSGGHKGPPLDAMIAFDNANHIGSICRALILMYSLRSHASVPVEKVKDEALRAALHLCDIQDEDGTWIWYGGPSPNNARKMCYHDLTMAGLLEVYRITKDRRFVGSCIAGIQYAMSQQTSKGLLKEQPERPMTWYNGLMTCCRAKAAGMDMYVPNLDDFANSLVWAIMNRARGFTESHRFDINNRLILAEGLSDYIFTYGKS
jgi:hypothetical protein